MALPITVPYVFGNVTTSIPLTNLDSDFATIYAAVNGIGNGTVALANVSITGGSIQNVSVTLDTINNTPIGNTTPSTGAFTSLTDTGLTSGRVTYAGTAGLLQDSANLTFNGTTLTANTLNLTNALTTSYGGTGLTSFTAGDLPYYSTGTALSKLAIGTNGYILQSNGSAPTWVLASSVIGGAGGSNTQVQYNSSGLLAGSANLTFDGSTLTTLNAAYTGTLTGGTGVVNLGSGQFYKDASGNVGIGTSSPSTKLQVTSSAATVNAISMTGSTTAATYLQMTTSGGIFTAGLDSSTASVFGNAAYSGNLYMSGAYPMLFWTNGTERMRIDSSGNLLVGTTSFVAGRDSRVYVKGDATGNYCMTSDFPNATTQYFHSFRYNGTGIGSITGNNTATLYNTFSDYRLKEQIAPMTGALATVSALKPVIYKWKLDNSNGQGFIAHELAEVVPDCVTGEKDAVDAEGNPIYQGIDTSFLVATLTAAIQELKAEVDAQAVEIATLKAK